MTNYNIEGNINFYNELFKSLDDESEDEATLCQINGLPLDANSVKLECSHQFNYAPLYKEICTQKFNFKTYDTNALNKKDYLKVKDSKLDYFIKCPYCRHIQFTILPYYEELGLKPKYGVNSLDPSLTDKPKLYNKYGSDDYTFYLYNKLFKKGECCVIVNDLANTKCSYMYTTLVENSDKSFCQLHYRSGIKQIKMNEKQKQKDDLKKQKEDVLEAKQKLLDEKNTERVAKGLAPLKRLPTIKNVVQQPQTIGAYGPDEEQSIGCKAVLKSGPNKGSNCGCNKIDETGLCKRHAVVNNDV